MNISCAPNKFRPVCGSPSARNGSGAAGPKHRWRAGGMLIQFLPKAPERAKQADLHPGDAPEGAVPHSVEEDDAWVEGQSLFGNVEDIELIDPDCRASGFVRLFHERGVRVFPTLPLHARCSCSRERSPRCWRVRPEGSRRDGQGRQGRGDVRILLVDLPVHAARSGCRGIARPRWLCPPCQPLLTQQRADTWVAAS